MSFSILAIAAAGFIALLVVVNKRNSKSISQINAAKAMEMQNDKQALILDVRTSEEFNSGHLKNAKNISVQILNENLSGITSWKNKPVLVYCHSGARSSAASQILNKNGFTNISNMIGGISSWSGAGNEVVK
jgi:phage shock protein E